MIKNAVNDMTAEQLASLTDEDFNQVLGSVSEDARELLPRGRRLLATELERRSRDYFARALAVDKLRAESEGTPR